MLVVGSAVEHHVTIGDRVSRVGVVVHGIGIQDVSAIVDLCLSAQLVHDAVLFLLQGTYGDVLLSHGGRRSRQRRLLARLSGSKKQLAGNYGRSE